MNLSLLRELDISCANNGGANSRVPRWRAEFAYANIERVQLGQPPLVIAEDFD